MSYNLALHYLQNNEDAEEVVQDVFLSVHHHLDHFKQQSSYSTWIYRITINKCLDRIKSAKRAKRIQFIESLFISSEFSHSHTGIDFNHPGVLLEQKEQLQKVFFAINQLKENQKTALILHKIEKLPQAEIAQIMNVSPKAVESLIQRAKLKLADLLKNNEG